MSDKKVLQGWGQIESYMRETRMTLKKKGYPIRKDAGGSVWADVEEMQRHRLLISANICESARECANIR